MGPRSDGGPGFGGAWILAWWWTWARPTRARRHGLALGCCNSHVDALGLENYHGVHGKKVLTKRALKKYHGACGKMDHGNPEQNPFIDAWCFIMINHHDSA